MPLLAFGISYFPDKNGQNAMCSNLNGFAEKKVSNVEHIEQAHCF